MAIDFNLKTGLSHACRPLKRHLSEMRSIYYEADAYDRLVAAGDPLVYSFYDLRLPEHPGDIAFGTSMVEPGQVGKEYFMTKGHFHQILETAEVYFCHSGEGMLLMENPEGDWEIQALKPGTAVYVPKRYAHRSINTSREERLVTYFAFRADAGHDYGTIEEKGFRKIVVEEGGHPVVMDNPKWK